MLRKVKIQDFYKYIYVIFLTIAIDSCDKERKSRRVFLSPSDMCNALNKKKENLQIDFVPMSYYGEFNLFTAKIDSLLYFDSVYRKYIKIPKSSHNTNSIRYTNTSPIIIALTSMAEETVEISKISKFEFKATIEEDNLTLDSIYLNANLALKITDSGQTSQVNYYIFPHIDYLYFKYIIANIHEDRVIENIELYIENILLNDHSVNIKDSTTKRYPLPSEHSATI